MRPTVLCFGHAAEKGNIVIKAPKVAGKNTVTCPTTQTNVRIMISMIQTEAFCARSDPCSAESIILQNCLHWHWEMELHQVRCAPQMASMCVEDELLHPLINLRGKSNLTQRGSSSSVLRNRQRTLGSSIPLSRDHATRVSVLSCVG